MKVGTVRGGHDLEAIRDAVNGWYVGVVTQRQAGHSRLAALGTPQSFVPIVDHGRENKSTSLVCRFGPGRKLQERKSFPPRAGGCEEVMEPAASTAIVLRDFGRLS